MSLLYDHENKARNKAAGHFYFSVANPEEKNVRVRIKLASNIWNNQVALPFQANLPSFYSTNNRDWKVFIWTQELNGDLVAEFDNMPFFYIARLEPYGETKLEQLYADIKDHPAVSIETIGNTVEQRSLEMIHIGSGKQRIFLRARAHPWESGGNWVIEGLVRELISQYYVKPEKFKNIAFDILPIANKDGVARGMTRFNLNGADLNRGFTQSREELSIVAPENVALLEWLDQQRKTGQLPQLALDLHNDCCGGLLVPAAKNSKISMLEHCLRRHTFSPENVVLSFNTDDFCSGLQSLYGIDAATLELNAKYIKGIEQLPNAEHWQQFGRDFLKVALDFIN